MRGISLLLLIVLAACLRYPYIGKDLPYFYNEDEAHHFNRVVNMVKEGTFDPNYFHKPSFHFYLRMPVVAASFLWEVSKGNIRSIQEIATKNPVGVGGYAFDASHPGIVKWNRAFSVLLSVLTVLFVYLTAKALQLTPLSSFFAGLIVALSPALVMESATIGVDVVVVFLCVLTTLLSVLSVQSRDGRGILVAAVIAGLAVSTKYNALPIVVAPITAALFGFSGLGGAVIAGAVSLIAFFVASPFIFVHLPKFLDQFAYEIWHYKIAGHEGHTAEPGFSQLGFYSHWFVSDAVGWGVAIMALLGVLLVARLSRKAALVLISFPLLYLFLMINQRANFTRNVLVMIPYLALFAVAATEILFSRIRLVMIAILVLCVGCMVPSIKSDLFSGAKTLESRIEAAQFIEAQNLKGVAAVNTIQLARNITQKESIELVGAEASSDLLALQGYNYLIRPISSGAKDEVIFHAGISQADQRIVENPAIEIVNLQKISLSSDKQREISQKNEVSSMTLSLKGDKFSCQSGSEEYCWLTTKLGKVSIPAITEAPGFSGTNGMVTVRLEVMSPWAQTETHISFTDFLANVKLPPLSPGKWETIDVKLPYTELKDEQAFYLWISSVKSPFGEGISEDTRRLGIAIRSVRVIPS